MSKGRRRPHKRYLIGVDLMALDETSRINLMIALGGTKKVTLRDVFSVDDVILPKSRSDYLRTYDLRKVRSLHTIDVSVYSELL
jgi:hypothetical protein